MAGFATDTLDLVPDHTILSEMTYSELISVTVAHQLTILSILAGSTGRIILLSPHEPSYWPTNCDSPNWQDGMPDPVPRWPHQIIERLAQQSLVEMALQAKAGLMVSYRGALELNNSIHVSRRESPCPSITKPYMAACPVGALTRSNYDLNTCWGYMRAVSEQSCLSAGYIADRACPISSLHPRMVEHSAYHMQQFLK